MASPSSRGIAFSSSQPDRSVASPILLATYVSIALVPLARNAIAQKPANELARELNELGRVSGEDTISLFRDQDVNLVYHTGKKLDNVQVTDVDVVNDAVRFVTVKNARSRSGRKLRAEQIRSMTVNGRRYELRPDDVDKKLFLIDKQRRDEEIDRRLRSSGNRVWREATQQEQAQAVLEHREYLERVEAAFPNHQFTVHETDFFLFFTDIPARQISQYIRHLDRMYAELGKAFHVAQGTNIWRGKAVIVAFLDKDGFSRFEMTMMDNPNTQGRHGLCHSYGNGNVIIGCHRGEDPTLFAKMLVHETTHGYLHRYRTSVLIASWINEGIADWVAGIVVKSNRDVARRRQISMERLRNTGSLGGNFFESKNIDAWQYGAASSLTEFMIGNKPQRFGRFVDYIKDGLSWRESLQAVYGVDERGLVSLFGRRIRVPRLQP